MVKVIKKQFYFRRSGPILPGCWTRVHPNHMQQALSSKSLDRVYSTWELGMMVALCAECSRRTRMAENVAEAKAVAERLRSVVVASIGRVRVQKDIMQAEGEGDVEQWLRGMVETERRVRQQMREDCE